MDLVLTKKRKRAQCGTGPGADRDFAKDKGNTSIFHSSPSRRGKETKKTQNARSKGLGERSSAFFNRGMQIYGNELKNGPQEAVSIYLLPYRKSVLIKAAGSAPCKLHPPERQTFPLFILFWFVFFPFHFKAEKSSVIFGRLAGNRG